MKCSRRFLPLRSSHCGVCNHPANSGDCFKGFQFTLRKILCFHKIPFGHLPCFGICLPGFPCRTSGRFRWSLLHVDSFALSSEFGKTMLAFFCVFNFPASPKEHLVLSEKVLKGHSSNLSSFILMYCAAPGSNPPAVAWCYFIPRSGIPSCCLPLAKKTNGYCVLEPCQVFCVSAWSVLLCFI